MIERRQFMKLAGGAVLAVAVGAACEPTSAVTSVVVDGRHYRSDGSGRIEVSADGGRTWVLHSDLGPDVSVQQLSAIGAHDVGAQVGFASHRFDLVLGSDEKKWLTVQ